MIPAKLATPGLLKIVLISFPDITSKILSCDSNYIANAVAWPKFGKSNISMSHVI